MRKQLALLSLILLLASAVSAYSFGSLSYTTSKEVTDRNITFQLGLTNPGDSKVRINLEATGVDNGEVKFPRQDFILEPTEVSKSPSGDGWVSIESGKYARVKKVPFYLVMDEKVDESFSVRLEASRLGRGDSSSIRPRAVQVRDYNYEVNYPENQVSSVDRGYRTGKEREDDDGVQVVRNRDNNDVEGSQNSTENEEIQVQNEKKSNSSKATKVSGNTTSNKDGIGTTTTILILGTLGSMAYLWTVI